MDMEQAYQEYSRLVYGYLLKLSHDPVLSEDLMQETFYQAMLHVDSYQGKSKFSSWLCGIARNLFYEWLRKHPGEEEIPEMFSAEDRKPSSPDILMQMHRLPEPYREVLYLRCFGDLSFAQIGEILEKSENYARVIFFRGKALLKEAVKNE